MLGRLLLIVCCANFMSIAYSGQNNDPEFITNKTLYCPTGQTSRISNCYLTLVVKPMLSMSYYKFTSGNKEWKAYRATFESDGKLVTLDPNDDIEGLSPPIITDGHFRPIISINGQMPGPTIIAQKDQILHITVYNELKNVEGISIHWHGMHQRGTPGEDGVAYITQPPIMAGQHMNYTFKASPPGTHWYHAHSGSQRTDGLYGALIVLDTLEGDLYDYDLPDQHTLILHDWQKDASIDLFYIIGTSLGYWKEPLSPPYIKYVGTRSSDNIAIGNQPFWSAIINDKGRHFDESGSTDILHTSLNYFNCSEGNKYRFRLIGAQALYSFKFSIERHSLSVVASDGYQMSTIADVDYVIVNTGERYDVIVNCNQEPSDYWIWAETIENETLSGGEIFYNPISKHRAEAVLHYETSTATTMSDITSTKDCTSSSKCTAVNCPFTQYGEIMDCINSEQFAPYDSNDVPLKMKGNPARTLFYTFGFDGEVSTAGSSVDGINFRLPPLDPFTNYEEFENAACIKRGCDHDEENICSCTQVIDISELQYGDIVELVLVDMIPDAPGRFGLSHPIHLHGHEFYIHDVGYPEYSENGEFERQNEDVECVLENGNACPVYFITVEGDNGTMKQEVRYKNNERPTQPNGNYGQKDTVILPFGGYVAIRFEVNNPGWWFIHCHIEIHQLEGMASVVKELITYGDGKDRSQHPTKLHKQVQPNQL